MDPKSESSKRRRELVLYFLLAYAISWLIEIPLGLSMRGAISIQIPRSVHYLASFGPFFAALIVSLIYRGWRGAAPLFRGLARPFFLSPEKGAQTAIYLASSFEVEGITGRYFIKKKPVKSSRESYNTDSALRLWDASASLTHLNTPIP